MKKVIVLIAILPLVGCTNKKEETAFNNIQTKGPKSIVCIHEGMNDNGYQVTTKVKITYNNYKIVEQLEIDETEGMSADMVSFAQKFYTEKRESLSAIDGIDYAFTISNNTIKHSYVIATEFLNHEDLKKNPYVNDELLLGLQEGNRTYEEVKDRLTGYTCR